MAYCKIAEIDLSSQLWYVSSDRGWSSCAASHQPSPAEKCMRQKFLQREYLGVSPTIWTDNRPDVSQLNRKLLAVVKCHKVIFLYLRKISLFISTVLLNSTALIFSNSFLFRLLMYKFKLVNYILNMDFQSSEILSSILFVGEAFVCPFDRGSCVVRAVVPGWASYGKVVSGDGTD